jgi:hypothetical protein
MTERIALFQSVEMTKRTYRVWLAAFGFCLAAFFSPVADASMTGIDHLADNLSVTNFWVNGTGGFRAGPGGRTAPSPVLPEKWHPGLTVHVVWDVRDWEHDKGITHAADVPVDPYTEGGGHVWVHFLADGTVRVVVSDIGPRAANYPGPHEPIPRKQPWDMYPPRGEWRDWNEQVLDDRIIKQRCITDSDPRGCESRAEERLRDDELADARRYLPRCASMRGQSYLQCNDEALLEMRAARFSRRCLMAPALPKCSAKKAVQDTPNASETKEHRTNE